MAKFFSVALRTRLFNSVEFEIRLFNSMGYRVLFGHMVLGIGFIYVIESWTEVIYSMVSGESIAVF